MSQTPAHMPKSFREDRSLPQVDGISIVGVCVKGIAGPASSQLMPVSRARAGRGPILSAI